MSYPDLRESFQAVDQSSNPHSSVQYLDGVSSLESVQAYKKLTYTLLRVQPGNLVLDVGCGTGEDAHALAHLVGSQGRIVGVDSSHVMIAEAIQRHQSRQPIEFVVQDAHALSFPDGSFDRCRADRVFQHLQDPRPVLKEMVRVLASTGRMVVCDPDWETFVIDMPDRSLTRRIVNFTCDAHPNGWSGRRLLKLCKEIGLRDAVVNTRVLIFTDFSVLDHLSGLTNHVTGAIQAGVVSPQEGERWLNSLKKTSDDGLFFSCVTGMIVSGHKP